MREQLQTYTEAEARAYTRLVRAVGEIGLQQIDHEYGPGFDDRNVLHTTPDPRALESFIFPWNSTMFVKAFLFHNGRHGRIVGNGTAEIMRYLELPEPYVSLAEAIAKIHDRVRTQGIKLNEEQSAEWFNRALEIQLHQEGVAMPANALDQFQTISREANRATIPILDGAQLIGQHATTEEYSSEISKIIAYTVASEDLRELRQSTGPLVSHLWCYELHGQEPTREQLIAFETSQLAMDHEYQHPFALWSAEDGRPEKITDQFINLRYNPYKSAVIEHCAKVLEGLESGQLRDYTDVIHFDVKFAIDCIEGRILPDYTR